MDAMVTAAAAAAVVVDDADEGKSHFYSDIWILNQLMDVVDPMDVS
jgi:hypothetical protein